MNIAGLFKGLRAALGCFLFFQIFGCSGSPLKSDEDIFFFPTSANQLGDGKWNVPIHHWVFEKEEESISRKFSQKFFSEIMETLGVSEDQAHSSLFRQRLMWFLVDNERNKEIKINLLGRGETLNLTGANGHAYSSTIIGNVADKNLGDWLAFKVNALVFNASKSSTKSAPINEVRKFEGRVLLIPKTGLSVISDIDDTIKVSEVLDKKALIKNTFVEPYQITKGFPEYYKKLQKQGAYFHYVSASPWQIYPSLKPFMDKHYPQGTVSLRKFRLKDASLIDFLKSSVEYKVEQIKSIIQRYPEHRFILTGDSGEHDPEVYAEIYKQFPKNIKSIEIRKVKDSNLSNERFSETFKQVPRSVWKLFEMPGLKQEEELSKGLNK